MNNVGKFRKTNLTRVLALILVMVLIFFIIVGCKGKAQQQDVQVNNNNESDASISENNQKENQYDAVGENGMVSSASEIASQIGVEIMKKGGNAIDAAVATGFALGAFTPDMNGIGGGGFMVIRTAKGEEIAIDFREMAPSNATPKMFYDILELKEDDKNLDTLAAITVGEGSENLMKAFYSGKAIGVPGDVAGLIKALETYGTMTIDEVMRPVIERMGEGIPITPIMEKTLSDIYQVFILQEEAGKIYLDENSLPRKTGDIFYNPDLVSTYKLIAEKGKDGFYKGDIAKAIVEAVQANGGVMTLKDLENYEVIMREPVKGTYRGYDIISLSPPSSGGSIVIEILNILENFDMTAMRHNTPESLHLWIEAMHRGYLDRAVHMGDPAYAKVPLKGLISKEYAKSLANTIDMDKMTEGLEPGNPMKYQSKNTTHYSVADKDGNMVSCTKSVNIFYGTGIVPKGTGFLLNNHMMDFDMVAGGSNQIEPGKRMMSSMSPTIVTKDGKPFMIVGAPGGPMIIAAVAQTISNVIDYNMDIQEAIEAPRIYAYPGFPASMEYGFSDDIIGKLKEKGHEIAGEAEPMVGLVSAVRFKEDGKMHGGADPRGFYKAVGY